MIKKLMISSVAVACLGISAPMAHAVDVTADCGFNTIAQEQVTGGQSTFTGGAYGYAASNTPGDSISVHCEVRVNGGTVASTDPGPSGQASVTAGQVTFTAEDTDTVTLCAVWTGTTSGEICGATTTQQIPPQEVIDLITQLTSIPDFLICPIFVQLGQLTGGGVPGVLDIAADGDIAIGGIPFWDCPPYELV